MTASAPSRILPLYSGDDTHLASDDLSIDQYFTSTPIAQWSMEDYIVSTGNEDITFLRELNGIRRIKRVPQKVSKYSHALIKHYEGVLGPEKMKLARIKALKMVNAHILNTKQRLKTQQDSETELDHEMASGSTGSTKNPFLALPNSKPMSHPVSSDTHTGRTMEEPTLYEAPQSDISVEEDHDGVNEANLLSLQNEVPMMGFFPGSRPRAAGSPSPIPLFSVSAIETPRVLFEDTESVSSDSTRSDIVDPQPVKWPLGPRATLKQESAEDITDGQSLFMPMPATPNRDKTVTFQDLNLIQFEKLNQDTEWVFNGVDLVDKFHKFMKGNDKDFSLARDGIADLSLGSDFERTLPLHIKPDVCLSGISTVDVNQRCPTLPKIFQRVFATNTYDEVTRALMNEDLTDPVVFYLMSIIIAHYFKFHNRIPQDLNEREAFVSFTWCFIRGALTMMNIESRSLEVLITGVEERKNNSKDPRFETKVSGQYADGIGFKEANQIYLAEAARLHQPKEEKLPEDEFKLVRAMRDSWINQLKTACRDSVPCRGMIVYGSSSYKDETKIWQMDFRGMFRLFQIDSFLIPQDKADFGRMMKAAALSCIELAIRIQDELCRRESEEVPASYPTRVELNNALRRIRSTTPTPEKTKKRKSESL
ncbi:hypothetical protein BGX20_006062 [Mortierella sp. AD010]|nr:hypothetical protein BGX20_006062 [Mortierella sp. AD010]